MSIFMKSASYRLLKNLNFACQKCTVIAKSRPLLFKNNPNNYDYYRFVQTQGGGNLKPTRKGYHKVALLLGLGTIVGGGYEVYTQKFSKPNEVLSRDLVYDELESRNRIKLPDIIKPTKKVDGPFKELEYEVTLYQYQSCPFCCKVRSFLDYYGIPYNLVEVHPVTKKDIKWSDYRKVPILLVKYGKDSFEILRESSVIISIMGSKVLNPLKELDTLVSYYRPAEYANQEGKIISEYTQKYFLMFGDDGPPINRTPEDLKNERKWRRWVDDELIHMISPNVYRTFNESIQTFKHFSKTGQWETVFTKPEQYFAIYTGAVAMYLIGKRLKSKYNLKNDVRESLYDSVNMFLRSIPKKKRFMGGDNPNLADLAVYGVLNSMKDCLAFNDMMEKTKIKSWYYAVAKRVENHEGYNQVAESYKNYKPMSKL